MTMAFMTMSLAEIFHSFNMRSQRQSILSLKSHNKYLLLAMAFSFVLTTMLIYVPVLRTIFGLTKITIVEYVIAIGIAFVVIPVVEIVKFIQRKVG
jgi:Ca2+-transporting ATPase